MALFILDGETYSNNAVTNQEQAIAVYGKEVEFVTEHSVKEDAPKPAPKHKPKAKEAQDE